MNDAIIDVKVYVSSSMLVIRFLRGRGPYSV